MATKYVSSLTGPEMDAALIDMAYHNSEAYAVGTRNGVAVGSSDVTYHNNSKYWAEQVYGYTDRAEDAANRAEAAVPASTEGAVFFSTAQTLTTAQQEQARANIKAGGSNRNLLDNPWFTVNQRGLTSGTHTTMPADRWKATYGSGSVNWTRESDGCITFGPTNTASHGDIYQRIPDEIYDALTGEDKSVTVSVMLQDGTIYSGTSYLPTASTRTYFVVDNVGGTSTRLVAYAQASNKQLFVQAFYGNLTVKAVKLEKGSVSTLANDAPPDYGEELAKCQYYCRVIETSGYFAFGIAAGSAHIQTPLQYAMRARPSVSFTGSIALFGANDLTVSSIIVSAWGPSAVCLDFVTTGATSRTPYIVNMSNAKIILSADL